MKHTFRSDLRVTACSFILLLLVAAPLQASVLYTSIDTMKLSRDHEANSKLQQAEIDQVVSLCASQNVTHITVDTHWDYTSVMSQWISSIRAHGKKAYFRGRPNQYENNNGVAGIMSPTDYIAAMVALITNNPTFFQPGDIFDPCSEPEQGHYWTNQYGANINWNSNPTATADYNAFLTNSTTAADAALALIGVSGVDTRIHSMNGWMAQNVLAPATLTALGNRVCIDTYPEGSNTDPAACATLRSNDLQSVHTTWPNATVLIGEMGYCNNAGVSDTVQSNVLSAELNVMAACSYIGGVNYWVGPGSSTAGGYTYVMQKVSGTWVARPACSALSKYFWNVLAPGAPQSVTASLGGPAQINLNWADNTEPNLGSYTVYRSTISGFTPGPANCLASNLASSSYSDTALLASACYYRVTAVSAAGLESAPSSQVAVEFPLNIQRSGPNLNVSWPKGILLEAPSVTGPWLTNPSASSPYTVAPTNLQRFYRVQTPAINPISVHFGNGAAMGGAEIAGVVSLSNWNNAVGTSGTAPANDATGAPSGATVSWNTAKSVTTNSSIPDLPGDYRMMRNYLDTSSTQPASVTLSNLSASNNGWKVYVYFDGSNSETRGGTYVLASPKIAVPITNWGVDLSGANFAGTYNQATSVNGWIGNYMIFTIGSITNFTITATATNGPTYPRAPLNGLQLVPQ